jgi:hypothetical protein
MTAVVHTLAVATVGLLMLLAGIDRHVLVRRISGRCPSCGRSVRDCTCN